MTPCTRVVWELERWAPRSALNLLCLVVLVVAYAPAATIATETITLHIPSTTVTLPNGLTVVVSPTQAADGVDGCPVQSGIGQRPRG